SITLLPPKSTLFPYTTLFRSTGIAQPTISRWMDTKMKVILPNFYYLYITAKFFKVTMEELTGLKPLRGVEKIIESESTRKTEVRSEEHTSELQSRENLVCRLL